jgi:flavodoxin
MSRKIAVIYFSLHGNTEFVARTISAAVDAVTIRIRMIHPLPDNFLVYVIGGFQAVCNIKPAIHPINFNLSEYSTIFLGTPVWGSRCSSPIQSFFSQYSLKGKNVALFACSGDKPGQAFSQLKSLLPDCRIIDQLSLHDAQIKKDKVETGRTIETWAKKCLES